MPTNPVPIGLISNYLESRSIRQGDVQVLAVAENEYALLLQSEWRIPEVWGWGRVLPFPAPAHCERLNWPSQSPDVGLCLKSEQGVRVSTEAISLLKKMDILYRDTCRRGRHLCMSHCLFKHLVRLFLILIQSAQHFKGENLSFFLMIKVITFTQQCDRM